METINNIKLQYAVESSINEALWRINVGADSLVNIDIDGVTTVYDSATHVLSVNVDKFQMESEILLDLSEDTHFDRGIAAEEEVVLNGYDPGLDSEQQPRGNFEFLPDVDIDYFTDNAVEIHTNSFYKLEDDTLTDGIHVFTGNYITLEDVTLLSGTVVFTGHHVRFMYDNYIASAPGDTTGALPAVVFTNPNQNFDLYSQHQGETIIGAIYCKGNVTLRNGFVSGPIVGKTVTMYDDLNFLDTENSGKFKWTKGFGHRDNYDWPKQIGRWKIHKWLKKNIAA